MSQSNPIVKITNNLPHSVDIYDVFNPSINGEVKPYKYTKLGRISSGETQNIQTIRTASMLQGIFSGKISEIDNNYYNNFPIKVMSAVEFGFDNPPPIEYTITSDDKSAMIQSFLFHRYAMANPSSTLTTNLYSAIKKGDVKSINTFFSSTKNFSDCTLSTWNAIQTWLQQSLSGWQGPFYLYEKAPNPTPSGYLPILVATLNITSDQNGDKATMQSCTTDSKGNPIYSIPSQTTTIIMNGDGTMGDSNPGQDISVNLTPVWMNVIQTSMKDGKPTSSYLAGPTLTGTIASSQVVSSQKARQFPNQKKVSPKQASSFDSSFGKISQGVGLLVGLLFLGEFASKIFKSASNKIEKLKEKASSKKEFEDQKDTVESTPDTEVVNEATTKESSFNSDSSSVAENYKETSESLQENSMTQTIEDTKTSIEDSIRTEIEDGLTPTEDFENAVSDLNESFKTAESDIKNGDLEKASNELSTASENINKTLENDSNDLQDWESSSLEESSKAVNEASETSSSLDNAQNEYENDIENSEDGGFNSEDSKFPETDPIEAVEV